MREAVPCSAWGRFCRPRHCRRWYMGCPERRRERRAMDRRGTSPLTVKQRLTPLLKPSARHWAEVGEADQRVVIFEQPSASGQRDLWSNIKASRTGRSPCPALWLSARSCLIFRHGRSARLPGNSGRCRWSVLKKAPGARNGLSLGDATRNSWLIFLKLFCRQCWRGS
jgi:hypothetical protein